MSFWNLLPLLPLLLAAPAAMLVARSLHRRRPAWSTAKLALVSAIPGSVAVLLLGGYFLTTVRPAAPDEIDSGGMIIAALMTLTPLYALLVLIVGAIAARSVHRRS